ncbi:MAG: hypothetical protein Q7R79_05380 [bacterium]|nr:hypothetical protein [bacterium]
MAVKPSGIALTNSGAMGNKIKKIPAQIVLNTNARSSTFSLFFVRKNRGMRKSKLSDRYGIIIQSRNGIVFSQLK